MSDERYLTVEEYCALAPTDAEWALKAVEPYAAMTVEERMHALSILNARIDVMLNGRMPETEDGEHPFWMHWKDPLLGRPRDPLGPRP